MSGFTLSVFEGGEAGTERAGGDQQNDKSKHVWAMTEDELHNFPFLTELMKSICLLFYTSWDDTICLARLEMNWHVCGMSVLFDLNYS